MKRERIKRRILYGLTVWAWVGGVGHFTAMDMMYPDNPHHRTMLILMLTVAVTLTTTSLFAVFVAPLQLVYRSGYEAGQLAARCTAQPDMQLQLIVGGRRKTDVQLGTVSKLPSRN